MIWQLTCRPVRNHLCSSTDFSHRTGSLPYSDSDVCYLILKENTFFFLKKNFLPSRRKQMFLKRYCILLQGHLSRCYSEGRAWAFLWLLFLCQCHLAVLFTNKCNHTERLHSKGNSRIMLSEGKHAWAAAFHPGGGAEVPWQVTG